MKHLMLLSNSTNHGEGYLDHAMETVMQFLGPVRRILFIPFALHDRVGYTGRVKARFAREGVEVVGIAEETRDRETSGGASGKATSEAAAARSVEEAEAIFVGGGNTFRLLAVLQNLGLLEPLRRRAIEGMPYFGASAGSVIAAPTLKTTNDMPIVLPASFDALGLVSFQINAHYFDPDPASRHMGETRELRIREFLEENETPVVGLREGSWLRVEGKSVRLEGRAGARIFRRGEEPVEAPPGSSLETLLG